MSDFAELETETRNQIGQTLKGDPIAIIGIGCRFPGGVNSPETFWQLLYDEVDAIGEVPPDRIDVETYYDARPATPGKIMTRWGGFLDQIDQFDAYFFGISPREADRMDPQQRLLLEVAWEALEDAGQVVDRLVGSQTGVFIGLWLNDYEARMFADPGSADFYMTTGSGRYTSSGRISYNFGFQGPGITIDTACSSSLVAVHLACQSLWSGECSLALAGGANVILQPHISIAYSQSRMMAPDGHCKFGDACADGYVRSEGAGLVVLKPLSQAVADGDPIYAVIRGSAVNNDGRSSGYLTTPGIQGQEEMLRRAYQDAGVLPSQVHYIEAHGTGTKAGDPVELGALGTVLRVGRSSEHPCAVGSVKTNLGHTEGAAGVAGLIKVALSLKHRTIPASLHLQEPNPNIPWTELGLMVPTEFTPWPSHAETALAGVSSFGIAGTNAHVVLAEAPPSDPSDDSQENPDKGYLLPLSAHTPEALESLANMYKDLLTVEDAPPLPDICYTASCRRTHHEYRLSLVGHSQQELASSLTDFLQRELPWGISAGRTEFGQQFGLVFVFPGQGSQWVGMGRQLLEQEPIFRQTLEQCEEAMQPFVGWSLLDQLTLDEESSAYRLNEIDVIQPTLLSIEIALATLWRSWGVEPDAVIGHSMGEVAAAYIAAALTLADAMRVICRRSQLLRRTSGQGAMAVVELAIEAAQAAIVGYEDRLSIAVSNSPRSTVLSGDPVALGEVIETLESQDIFCRLIKVDVASHSPQMDPLKADLLAALEGLQPQAGSVPIYSTPLGIVADGADYDAAYWVHNLRQPVLFSKMVQQLLVDGHNVFIEMSPHPILLPAIQQGFQHAGKEGMTLPSLRRNEVEQATILSSLGALYTSGYPITWERLYPSGGCCVRLPLYPWQRERFWYEGAATQGHRRRTHLGSHPLLGPHIHAATGSHLWEIELSTRLFPYLADHQVRETVVLPAAAYVEMALAAASEAFGPGTHTLTNVVFKEALFLPEADVYEAQLIITATMPGTATFQFFSRAANTNEPQAWLLHTSGTIRLDQTEASPAFPAPAETVRSHSQTAISGSEHYRAMADRELHYGSSFQALAQLWPLPESNEVIGELQVPESIASESKAYRLHPALIDASFQLLIATLNPADQPGTYLPLELDHLEIYGQPDVANPLWGYAIRRSKGETLSGDVFVIDKAGQLIMAAYGLQMLRLAREMGAGIEDWLYELQWQTAALAEQNTPDSREAGTWLLFTDTRGIGEELASRLAELGKSPVMVYAGPSYQNLGPGQYQLDPTQPDHFRRLLQEALPDQPAVYQGLIHLWSLDAELSAITTLASLDITQNQGCLTMLHLIQALNGIDLAAPPRLWLVTSGTQAIGTSVDTIAVSQASLWGLGGVIVNEHPELGCKRIDLSSSINRQELDALWAELWSDSAEDQVALRNGQRYVARLVRQTTKPSTDETMEVTKIEALPGQAYQLEIPTPGILDKLILQRTTRHTPGPGQVEIEVRAAGLNFIDVMKAMGLYPGLDPNAPLALGAECTGKVTAVGHKVDGLKVGDEVIAITPSFDKTSFFRAYVTVPVELVVPKPVHLSFEEAATIPINFLTAYYALMYLGRLSKDEQVLIHSATGGVGLAAIQLARSVEATIFATAGSPEKRAYLRELGIQHVMDSRSLAFAEEVLAQTDDKGVDLVLNSLAGEAIGKGLSVLGPYGRFLEIGKRDIYQNNQLGLEPFKRNLAFFAIDLARVTKERPALIGSLFGKVMHYFEDHRLHPLPFKVFPISEASEAFRYMAQARHIGKIVISLKDQAVMLTERVKKKIAVRSNGTYLITGGLGGLGLTVARWLADQEAGHLILMGRSGTSATAQAVIAELEEVGTQVTVARADVTQPETVASVLEQIKEPLPPLRGVIHAAGILDDGMLLQLDQEKFKRVTAPKLKGAWNLHTLTQDAPLDFFILFSSVTALLGSPGQGNYVAANAFLDALAHHRRAQGLPGLSIDWGPWAEVGLAAAQSNRGDRLASRGVGLIRPDQGIVALAKLLRQETAQVGVMPFDWQRWLEYVPAVDKTPFFNELRAGKGADRPKPGEGNIRDVMLAAEPGRQRRSLFEAHLRKHVAQVLRLAPARVPLNKPLKTLGFDSLMALELRNRLEASLGLNLSATLIFNYPTIEVLTPYLAEKMDISLEATASNGDATVTDLQSHRTDGLADLSHDEVEAMLMEELAAIDDLLEE